MSPDDAARELPRGPLHPMCRRCGWAMGGQDSWNGRACKCGHSAPPFPAGDPAEPAAARSEG